MCSDTLAPITNRRLHHVAKRDLLSIVAKESEAFPSKDDDVGFHHRIDGFERKKFTGCAYNSGKVPNG